MTAKSMLTLSAVLILSGALAACDKNKPTVGSNASFPDTTAEVKQKVENATEKTGQVIDDSAITAKAKLDLAKANDLKSGDISVETVQGRVTLSGNVPSEAESQRAASIVGSVEGVKGVDNRLTVKTPT